ncbi:MAG TPA: hypothetical protein VMB20_03125, partial [Candidatus Acidoferrum sp.]|nr:hypothetical protein [Candidatus Acidoferrum sp.]
VETGNFNLVLPVGINAVGHFLVEYDPYRLVMREFAGDAKRGGNVYAKLVGDRFVFMDAQDAEYAWAAELRSAVAHSFAQKMANQFARVGLDLPEWIREKN